MSLSVWAYATANEITNSFRCVRRPVLPHAGPRHRSGSLSGESKKVNYFQVFKKDVIIIPPYFGWLS